MPELLNNFSKKRGHGYVIHIMHQQDLHGRWHNHADEADDTSDVSMIYLLFFVSLLETEYTLHPYSQKEIKYKPCLIFSCCSACPQGPQLPSLALSAEGIGDNLVQQVAEQKTSLLLHRFVISQQSCKEQRNRISVLYVQHTFSMCCKQSITGFCQHPKTAFCANWQYQQYQICQT